jgi:transcriptional regulator of acetoin/glycerol metabolism
MALAISITHSIESDLSISQLIRREKLRLAYCDFQIKWPGNASFVIDEFGYIIDTNSNAYTLLDNPVRMLNQPVHSFFPEISTAVHECLENGYEKECEVEIKQTLTDYARLHIEPAKVNRETLGCFVMFIDKKFHHSASFSLQSNEDQLIRKALLQADGNISKAARILNINRTTIYRRRKNWQE